MDLELADAGGFLERRLLLSDYSEDLRDRFGARRARARALPESEPRGTIVIGAADRAERDADLDAELGTLAGAVAALLRRSESPAGQLDRLRRLEQVDALLPTLFQVLDVREHSLDFGDSRRFRARYPHVEHGDWAGKPRRVEQWAVLGRRAEQRGPDRRRADQTLGREQATPADRPADK